MINNNIIWMISGVVLIIILLIILLSIKNKKQLEIVPEKIPATHQRNYNEHPNYPSKQEQISTSNQTSDYNVKPPKLQNEETFYSKQSQKNTLAKRYKSMHL